MKNLVILFSFFFSVSLFGQQNIPVQYQISTIITDSARVMVIDHPDGFQLQKKMILAWNTPQQMNESTWTWNSVTISGLGSELKIVLTDGIETIENGVTTYQKFSPGSSKYQLIRDLKPSQKRILRLEFFNSSGINVINTKQLEIQAKAVIENIILTVK